MICFCAGAMLLSCKAFRGNNQVKTNQTKLAKLDFNMGIALYSFNPKLFSEALAMADSAKVNDVEGFSSQKLGSAFNNQTLGAIGKNDIDKVKELLKKKGLKMNSMFMGGKNADDWKRVFELGHNLGLKYIVCEPAKKYWDLIDSLTAVYKIKVAIHEHAKGYSNFWHPDSVLVALKGHPNMGVCADLGHWARSGLDVVECLRKLEGHILELHIKDVDELGNKDARDVDLGKGVIDYKAVLTELKRQKFKGNAYVECEQNMGKNLKEVKRAITYIQNLATER